MMAKKPTYEELEQRVKELEKESIESKRIEKSLRDSEEQYRLFVKSYHDVPYSVTFDGIITFIGPQVARFGYTQEDMISKHLLEFVVREQQQEVMHSLEKGIRIKTNYPIEFQLQGKDGRLHWVEVIGEVICDNLGHPFLQIGTIREITGRKQTEEALQTREKLIEALINNQIDAATVVDKELKMLYVNKFLADRFGRSVDEMIGLSPEDVGDKSDIVTAKRVAYFKQVATTGKPARFEDKREETWFDTVVTPVLDKKGKVAQVAILARDITDKKRVEKALLDSEERYRGLVETMAEGLAIQDENGLIIYVNKRFCKMVGYQEHELMGKKIIDFLDERNKQIVKGEIAARRKGAPAQPYETEITRKDGHQIWVFLSPRDILDSDGQFEGSFAVFTDISSRKQAEENLRLVSSRLLTAQERERKRISLELHDELGQSLVALKLQLSSIEGRLEEDQTELRSDCEAILDHIVGLIGHIRRICKDLSPVILDDLGLTAGIRWLVENALKNHNIDTSLDISDIDKLLTNEQQLLVFRIFQEAFTNIVRHSLASLISIVIRKQGGEISLVIEDNGKGFDVKEAMGRDFIERGMGLSGMKERAWMLGGSLKIWSQRELGTRIDFRVPTE